MTQTPDAQTLSNLLKEERRFPPPAEMVEHANLTAAAYDEAKADRLAFWERQAEHLDWAQKWDKVLEWDAPFAKWFTGGKLNVALFVYGPHTGGSAVVAAESVRSKLSP